MAQMNRNLGRSWDLTQIPGGGTGAWSQPSCVARAETSQVVSAGLDWGLPPGNGEQVRSSGEALGLVEEMLTTTEQTSGSSFPPGC